MSLKIDGLLKMGGDDDDKINNSGVILSFFYNANYLDKPSTFKTFNCLNRQ